MASEYLKAIPIEEVLIDIGDILDVVVMGMGEKEHFDLPFYILSLRVLVAEEGDDFSCVHSCASESHCQ